MKSLAPIVESDAAEARVGEPDAETKPVSSPPSPANALPTETARPQPRSIRVSDFEKLSKQVEDLDEREKQMATAVEAVQDDISSARQTLHGLDLLRAVPRQEEHPLGQCVQQVLEMRLVERLLSCPSGPPPGGRASTGRARQEQCAITFEVPFPRGALAQLRAMLSLACAPRPGKITTRRTRIVRFARAADRLRSLGLSVEKTFMCRSFKRLDGSAPARLLLERHTDEAGKVYYFMGRDGVTEEVAFMFGHRRRFIHTCIRFLMV